MFCLVPLGRRTYETHIAEDIKQDTVEGAKRHT